MQSFGGDTEENALLTLSRRREDNIEMDFEELGWEGVYWILYFVELLGWLVSPEISACATLYSIVHVLLCCPVQMCLYYTEQVCPYCTVQFSALYSTNVPVQYSVFVLYSNSVSVLYTASLPVLYTTYVLVL